MFYFVNITYIHSNNHDFVNVHEYGQKEIVCTLLVGIYIKIYLFSLTVYEVT